MLNKFKNLLVKEEGQGLSEYGLLLAAVVGIVALAIGLLRTEMTELFTNILG